MPSNFHTRFRTINTTLHPMRIELIQNLCPISAGILELDKIFTLGYLSIMKDTISDGLVYLDKEPHFLLKDKIFLFDQYT